MGRSITKHNILKLLLCEEWFFDELNPHERFVYRIAAIPAIVLILGALYVFRLMDNDTLRFVLISMLVTAVILAIQYHSRQEKDPDDLAEKTDQGFGWFYINLSYRRRFRRTIGMIVFLTATMAFLFIRNEGEHGFYISRPLIVVVWVFATLQSLSGLWYNHKKWKEAEQNADSYK